jgi:hypothetical protein
LLRFGISYCAPKYHRKLTLTADGCRVKAEQKTDNCTAMRLRTTCWDLVFNSGDVDAPQHALLRNKVKTVLDSADIDAEIHASYDALVATEGRLER